jgi:osmotically inducible lipoprotein OsmB
MRDRAARPLRLYAATLILTTACVLSACGSSDRPVDRAAGGAGIGAGAGAAVGLLFGGIGAIPGALIGGAVGGTTGAVTDEEDINLGQPVWQ